MKSKYAHMQYHLFYPKVWRPVTSSPTKVCFVPKHAVRAIATQPIITADLIPRVAFIIVIHVVLGALLFELVFT